MLFDIEKYATIAIRTGKIVADDGMKLSNEDLIKVAPEEGYKHLGILEASNLFRNKSKKILLSNI